MPLPTEKKMPRPVSRNERVAEDERVAEATLADDGDVLAEPVGALSDDEPVINHVEISVGEAVSRSGKDGSQAGSGRAHRRLG